MTNKIVSKNLFLGIAALLFAGILVGGGIGNAFSQNTTDSPSVTVSLSNDTTSGSTNATGDGFTGNWSNTNYTTPTQ